MENLKIFTQPGCGYCTELKAYLNKHNIPFEDKDITKDKGARDELLNKYKVRATPLIVYGEKTLIGFKPDELEKMIGKAGQGESAEAK